MLSNENIDRKEIMKAHREAAIRRIIQLGEPVLAIQGTASLNYNTQTKMEGAGYISDKTLGVNIHSRLAVTAGGLTLGVLSQPPYNRPQPSNETRAHESKKTRVLEGKESFRWVQTLGESTAGMPCGAHIVTVCGREGDMAG
jgi:hypothetical protein